MKTSIRKIVDMVYPKAEPFFGLGNRSGTERRDRVNRRQTDDERYFSSGGHQRRSQEERRTNNERRSAWAKKNHWKSSLRT